MATFNIQNAPKNLTMVDFRALSDLYGSLARSCRFIVEILPVGQKVLELGTFWKDLVYLAETAEMPGRGFMNIDVRYYGPSQKLPFQTAYEDMNITFLCRNGSLEREFFDNWMYEINPINSFDFNYRDDYRSEISIFQYAEASKPVGPTEKPENVPKYMITLHNAFPILVNPQPLNWGDNAQFQRLVVNFTYSHWSRKLAGETPKVLNPPNGDLVTGKVNQRIPISRST